ncbi:DUF4326 domain-containing protein [Frankia sp. R82]|uniref:DUF4326 domain-containing protein n=1 Tax=Frankia sp. R82 TaxID=2950553 RepID=UPI0020436D24|nr:DUF4326 domain-containing protein [Frankia sp. R82]MCM3886120.1 DUF4326 domain-containing protein [Frankia sp. R82]
MIEHHELATEYFTRYGHPGLAALESPRPWTEAKRVQLRRGQPLPALTKKITRPSRWGNPFTVAEHGQAGAVERHRDWLNGEGPWLIGRYDRARVLIDLPDLGGYDLACACELGQPCHGNTLLALLADRPGTTS